ncbi:unnamed protein product [Ilex paraguariensis]|uniref:Secreted protein n=1 Tax=Ilex paraguariensis TaxID=185542 RepID=A0ABC8S336_9AQUA
MFFLVFVCGVCLLEMLFLRCCPQGGQPHRKLSQFNGTDDFCLALDQSERSYQLLGGYAAGQLLYYLYSDPSQTVYIVFCPERSYGTSKKPRVKLPILHASEEHLMEFEFD